MADVPDSVVDVNVGAMPAPGSKTSEFYALLAAALVTLAGLFHKNLDMKTATEFVDALVGLYMMGRSGVKMAHSLTTAVLAWVATQRPAAPAAPAAAVSQPPAPPPAPAAPVAVTVQRT